MSCPACESIGGRARTSNPAHDPECPSGNLDVGDHVEWFSAWGEWRTGTVTAVNGTSVTIKLDRSGEPHNVAIRGCRLLALSR